jgi:hypothetical protein
MKHKIIAAALAATLLGGGAALAAVTTNTTTQRVPGPGRDPMTRADADKDGVVTKAELLADVDARFAKVDANKDGKITADERQARFEGRRGRMAKRMMERHGGGPDGPRMGKGPDADGDGIVTREEQRAQALKIFAFVDRNSDGKVEQAEREQVREAMMAMRGPGGPGPHRGHRGPPGDMPPPSPPADAPTAPSNGQ